MSSIIKKLFFSIALLNCFIYTCSRFVDLSHDFSKSTPVWPGRITTLTEDFKGDTEHGWVASRRFCISEHTSTHIDANYHFDPEGWTLDQIPLERLLGIPGVMIDISKKVFMEDGSIPNINYECTPDDLIEWEAEHGQIPPNSVVFLNTGWSSRWREKNLFLGIPKEDQEEEDGGTPSLKFTVNTNSPGFGEDAAKWLMNERQLYGCGIDTISLDTGDNKVQAAHQVFMKKIWLVENANNLHLLPPTNFTVWLAPFKVDKGTGAPVRIIAKIPDDE